MHNKTLPTLIKVIIKCTVHYIVHLQCTFSLIRMKVRDSDVLDHSSRDDRAMKNTVPVLYSTMYSFEGWRNNKNNFFSIKALHKR